VLPSLDGVLRVLRDVVVQSATHEHMVVISRHPSVLGELVSVQLPHDEGADVTARVLESHPIVLDGSVRYLLRLHHGNGAGSPGQDKDNQPPRGIPAND
jgi:hypothetical protein